MGREIERRFLVKNNNWKKEEDFAEFDSYEIEQGYLSVDPERVVRVRTQRHTGYTGHGFITVKGRKKGNSCVEYETIMELSEVKAMLKMCIANIHKKRYEVSDNKLQDWEIDVFSGPLKGLVIAEIELSSEKEKIILPSWIGEEITTDHAYSNLSLAQFGIPERYVGRI